MATLEKIRNKGGLLVTIFIGFALVAFILGDILNSGGGSGVSNDLSIAEVHGEELNVQDYQNKLDEVFDIYRMNRGEMDDATADQLTTQTWDDFIKDAVLAPMYEAYNIEISMEEMKEMVQGENLHPIIPQVFGDPNTGEVNRDAVRNFIANLNGEFAQQKPFWLYIEKEIVSKRKITKFNNLVSKAIYVTNTQIDQAIQDKSPVVDFEFVAKRKAEVADSLVSFTEADITNYYKANKHKFVQENTVRNLKYITYDVMPSAQDNQDAQKWIEEIKSDFQNAVNDAQFVNINSDEPFNDQFYGPGQLDARLDTILFDEEPGFVYGPYFENMTYKLAKLSNVAMRPDSVKASHILIRNDQGDADIKQRADNLLDSLKTLVENGADFAELAKQYSEDGSAPTGGDLGWFSEGMMVKPFNDACFSNSKGSLVLVDTQFGHHLIQVNELSKPSKKIQVAILARTVEASTATFQNYYAQASSFASDNRDMASFDAAIEANGLNPRTASVQENDRNIPGLESPRAMVKWAYEAETGQVSDVFEFGNRFVVACLTDLKEKGTLPLDDVRKEVESAVLLEKKGDYIKNQLEDVLKSDTDLDNIALAINGKKEKAEMITMESFQIPGFGIEHAVIAHAIAMQKGETSGALVGENAVFVINLLDSRPGTEADRNTEKTRIAASKKGAVETNAYDAVLELAELEDKRSKWY